MNLPDVHTHLLHDLHAVAEREDDTLLGGTYKVSLRVLVEVQAIDGTANLTVLQYTLSAIAERNNGNTLTADGSCSCQVVHLSIRDVGSDVTMYPGVQDTRTIDAEQHTETGLGIAMVDMGKRVNTALLVIVYLTQNTIYNT